MTTTLERGRAVGEGPSSTLTEVWSSPRGLWGSLSAVNHKKVGLRFIVTAFVFLFVGGLEAMLIRTQLARPESGVLSPEAYNETFTLHGSTMMFLFAVPILEGLAMYLLPLMLGTRDMPFPRLNAFGYWSYLFGGLFVYASIFAGAVPDGGWFAYVPLTNPEFSPGSNLDFWLLGVTFVEIAGLVGAVELIVLILKHRAPGMSLSRMPLFGWATLVMAIMMLFAFTTLATASVLLELERSAGLPFFDPDGGGEPLLWQHLFWIFGHPEVYIMLLPATGIVSMVVATFARRAIIGYGFIVAALVAIGFVSFGLWVHHMFAVGIPFVAMAFFTAASMIIAIPSGIQIFAWIATLWRGSVRWGTPLWFVLGFFFIFVAGGITGVMVAMVPFDWQVHDSFFVVAHFHYVLIGGVLFPIFAALHYWWPKFTGRMPSERWGKVSFWLMLVGFNVAFFPQHILGLLGMPRRVYTYADGLGWETLNLVSTAGSYILGLGTLVFAANLVGAWRRGPEAPANPWGAGTLEWATSSPPDPYNFERLPVVGDREPLWNPVEPRGRLAELQGVLEEPHEGFRETWATSLIDAEPEEIVHIAQPSHWPLGAASSITAALAGVIAGLEPLAYGGAALTVVCIVAWLWPSPSEAHREALEDEEMLQPPAPARHPGVWVAGVWGSGLAALIGATALGALVFSYVRLTGPAEGWPSPEPGLALPVVAVALVALGTGLLWWARLLVERRATRPAGELSAGAAALIAAAAAFVLWRYLDQLDLDARSQALPAMAGVLVGFAIVVVLVAAAATVLVVVRSATRERPHPEVLLQAVAVGHGFALVATVVALATVVIGARVV